MYNLNRSDEEQTGRVNLIPMSGLGNAGPFIDESRGDLRGNFGMGQEDVPGLDEVADGPSSGYLRISDRNGNQPLDLSPKGIDDGRTVGSILNKFATSLGPPARQSLYLRDRLGKREPSADLIQ